MTRLWFYPAVVAAWLAAFAFGAHAADLAGKPVLKAPPAPIVPATGLYFGIGAIAGNLDSKFDFLTAPGFGSGNINPTGWGGVASAGVRGWNAGGGYVGLNADFAWLATKGGTQCLIVDQCTTDNHVRLEQTIEIGAPLAVITGQVSSLNTQVARAVPPPSQWPIPITPLPVSAWAMQMLPFIAAGVAEERFSACITGTVLLQGCTTSWLVGWTAGGGIYVPLATNIDLKTKVMYTGWNQSFTPGTTPPIAPLLQGNFHTLHEITATESLVFHF